MPKYSGACNFYYGVKVYSFVPARLGRGLTSSSIIRFGGGRSLSTLKLASSTIEAKGSTIEAKCSFARSYLEFYC